MELDDEGTMRLEHSTPSYFERRRVGILGPRKRKRKFTEFWKEEARRDAERSKLLKQKHAAARLWVVLHYPAANVPPRRAVVQQLGPEDFPAWPKHNGSCTFAMYEYCAYVRALITSASLADALGVPSHAAASGLSVLASEGLLREVRRIRVGRGTRSIVWEWAGP
jgi:hypothetical protein